MGRTAHARRPTLETAAAGIGHETIGLGALPSFLGYALRRAQLVAFEDFRRSVGSLGLRPAQFSVLVVVDASPGLKQTEVAAALGIQRTNFVAMASELERLGLIERRPLDRRSHALHLTQAGSVKLAEALRLQAALERRYAQMLGVDGRETLLRLLSRLEPVTQDSEGSGPAAP